MDFTKSKTDWLLFYAENNIVKLYKNDYVYQITFKWDMW